MLREWERERNNTNITIRSKEEDYKRQAKKYFKQADKQEENKDLVRPILIIGLILWFIGCLSFFI